MTNNLDMRRNLAPSRTGIPSLHQRIGVAFPQGFVPPIRKNLNDLSKTNTGIYPDNKIHGRQNFPIVKLKHSAMIVIVNVASLVSIQNLNSTLISGFMASSDCNALIGGMFF